MKREIQFITSIEIELEIDQTSDDDKNNAFDKFKEEYPNAYSPDEEYIVIYDDASDFHDIYRLL